MTAAVLRPAHLSFSTSAAGHMEKMPAAYDVAWRIAWAIVTLTIVQVVVCGVSVLPVAVIWIYLVDMTASNSIVRLAVFSSAIVPSYVLFALCLMIISPEYVERIWTNHERRSAQARALQECGGRWCNESDRQSCRADPERL